MNKFLLLSILLHAVFTSSFAQTPEDALRNTWFIPSGTARYMAIGGAMGSLGGDISANHVNPAGIGLYRTAEFVLTPGMMLNHNKFDYRGSNSSSDKNAFAYGTFGFVAGTPGRNPNNSTAFSLSMTQLASFNNKTYFSGLNNVSSYSEQYVEELTRDGASIIAAENNYIFGSSLAYRTYLVDSVNQNGQLIGYKTLATISSGVIQEKDETTTGGMHEFSLSFASNQHNKLYFGGSLNIPFSKYKRDLAFSETDASTAPDNNFDNFEYNENLTSSGVGFNVKLGLIYRIQDNFRLGIALHSPSFMGFEDNIRSSMQTNTEGYAGIRSESSDNLNDGNPGQRNYNLLTPWRAIMSASYILRSVENTKLQRGFITADIEYVDYGGMRFYAINDPDQATEDYYTTLNEVTKEFYSGAFNFRAGGELKFDPVAIRLGGSFYGSPYSNDVFEASRLVIAGGLGYRKHGIFIDLTYAQTINKDVSIPYLLNDKPNTFATWKNNKGNILLTVGFKI